MIWADIMFYGYTPPYFTKRTSGRFLSKQMHLAIPLLNKNCLASEVELTFIKTPQLYPDQYVACCKTSLLGPTFIKTQLHPVQYVVCCTTSLLGPTFIKSPQLHPVQYVIC
ncbi:hypothetical protein TNIN_124881 [Trichonephila inaurata madagascariensis]|uniref:Uncharacterized protein n=1 Tax=Trichonephila inaurata madagascariensis TaxID=2747483 RepID=A0A8X6YKS2_9ARAC|nr:hypothetical protein TNIN_124881 [Trichonephila inaurata madagascariensis]